MNIVKPLKICYIADAKSVHTQRLVNYFSRKGHEVHLISSRFMEGYDARIFVHPLPRIFPRIKTISRILSGLWWLYEIRRLVKKIKPDILDAHFLQVAGYLGLASGFHPFIMSTWGSDILVEPRTSILARWAAKAVLKRADLVICISKFLYNAISEYTSLIKVRMVPFGVDPEMFKPAIRKQATGNRTIGIIKALEPIYGIEYLIRAVPLIIRHFPDLKVLIIGAGNQEPYRRLAKELNIENIVEFTGRVSNEEVPRYLEKMEVFVMPSLSESFGVSALEAQAMEVPVVASRVGGIPEAVNDGIAGFLVESKNPKAIADAVIKLLADDYLREKMGKKGREFVIDNYNWEKTCEKREKLYRSCLA